MGKIGVYIHVPFCRSKCPYCDFYSFNGTENQKDAYIRAVKREMEAYAGVCADTVYVGGGTPSVLKKEQLADVIETAKRTFSYTDGEITVEINPSSCTKALLQALYSQGVNRLSFGLQSAVEEERKLLGRQTCLADITRCLSEAREIGFRNISLDLMLGIPEQTMESLEQSLFYCIEQKVEHVSAYMLKLEEGTPFYRDRAKLAVPDEDAYCRFYETTCDLLEKHGYKQYEISNFARPGFESRHNLKYWNCEEYIGIGVSAHSFYKGNRFFHDRDVNKYLVSGEVTQDGTGGNFEEYAMLRLRLTEGLLEKDVVNIFHKSIPKGMRDKCEKFVETGHVLSDESGIRLTKKGFLISNYILSSLLFG